jgi:hypothetical protein
MKTILLALVALLSVSFLALAADITGTWTADVPGRGGNTQTTTFVLKSAGSTLTGTTTGGRGGENPIEEGKIDGDSISFSQTLNFNGNSIKQMYKGKVNGDTIEFTREVEGRGGPVTFTAKKQK